MSQPVENLIIDMVHHNPGEAPFETVFSDPFHLKSLGYNAQCFKHINTVMRFDRLNGVTGPSLRESRWLARFESKIRKEIRLAKEAGLLVFYHVDLFILPKRIIESLQGEICDPKTGLISIHSEKNLELHRLLFEEMFTKFPQVDGVIPRIGETYLFDTPFHAGNGAVVYKGENASQKEVDEFVLLLKFLRREICEKHNRYLVHRTWDIQNNRFHSNRDFYLKVTDEIPPHQKLFFSIKHTHIDFHRYAKWNPCLGHGQHRQVVEVQCQREYEGKGAFPNFASSGVVDGFPEAGGDQCLRSFVNEKNFGGVFSWSRGGGWYGPYVGKHNEFWVDLNVRYLLGFLLDTRKEEFTLFSDIAWEGFGLQSNDQYALYRISKLSLDAVLEGKFCRAWDTRPGAESDRFPTNQWMRDDVLGGWDLLNPVFTFLYENSLGEEAIREKMHAVEIWKRIVDISCQLEMAHHPELKKMIQASCHYGLRLFSFIACAWRTLFLDFLIRQGDSIPQKRLKDSSRETKILWEDYRSLENNYTVCASLYRSHGWCWPKDEPPPGLGDALAEIYRNHESIGQV